MVWVNMLALCSLLPARTLQAVTVHSNTVTNFWANRRKKLVKIGGAYVQ